MFKIFKKKVYELYSPVIGKSILLEQVNDKVFAEKMMGDGLDTVNLNGIGLTSHVKTGSTVKRGDVLLTIDRKLMDEKQIDLTTPMIITSPRKELEISDPDFVNLQTKVIRIT